VTSPPYYGLRAYGTNPQIWGGNPSCVHEWSDSTYVRNNDQTAGEKQRTNVGAIGRDVPVQNAFCSKCGAWLGELGLEPTPGLYVEHLVTVFREVKRVLRDDGTFWLNLGDSFNSPGPNNHNKSSYIGTTKLAGQPSTKRVSGLKPKDLMGIPWRVAFALQSDGWWLRSDIVWHKPNPMPESVTDRPTRSHEYLFLLAKSERYFYDSEAIKEPCADESIRRISEQTFDTQTGGDKDYGNGTNPNRSMRKTLENFARNPLKRNKRDVWTIPTKPFPGSHFAVMPEALVEPCIKAGTSEKGCCPKCGSPWKRITKTNNPSKEFNVGPDERYDGLSNMGDNHQTVAGLHRNPGGVYSSAVDLGWQPTCSCNLPPVPCVTLDFFGGSGTVAKVSRDLGRDSIYCDLNPSYVQMAINRVGSLFTPIEYRKV
jgi:DNA modification methylase